MTQHILLIQNSFKNNPNHSTKRLKNKQTNQQSFNILLHISLENSIEKLSKLKTKKKGEVLEMIPIKKALAKTVINVCKTSFF